MTKDADNKKLGLLNNLRFYILTISILGSFLLAAYLRLVILGDQLFYIRLEQIYGLVAILFWYVALIISPLGYVVGKEKISYLIFARRAIGVSAAYFAILHFLVAIFGQLGGLGNFGNLPGLFKVSILLGSVSLIILLIMALTSFDRVVKIMTFKRWKMLHRLVYVGGIAAVAHIWMIGTHIAYVQFKALAFTLLAVLGGLEAFRIAKRMVQKNQELQSGTYFITIFLSIWMFFIGLVLALPLTVKNYHGANHVEQVEKYD